MAKANASFRVDGDALILGFSEFPRQEFNLSAVRTCDPRVMRIYRDENGALVEAAGYWLVAEVAIPAAQWVSADAGAEGEEAVPKMVPLSADDVHLTLWDLGGIA